MPAEVYLSRPDSPSSRLTSPAPGSIASSSFPHQPTQPTLTTALHRSHSHVHSLASSIAIPSRSVSRSSPSPSPSASPSPSSSPFQSSTSNHLHSSAHSSLAAETLTYRRILFAELSPSQPVPPLTAIPQLDDQLYLLLAFLLRATVLPWYSKLTPNRQLLTEIVRVIQQVLVQLPSRLDAQLSPQHPGQPDATSTPGIDNYRLHALIGRELPIVLRQHYRDVRDVRRRVNSAWAPHAILSEFADAFSIPQQHFRPSSSPRLETATSSPDPQNHDRGPELEPNAISPQRIAQLHYLMSPHPGVDRAHSVEGKLDLVYTRIAVSSLLASLLPPEDWSVDVERYMVRDITVTVLRSSLAKCTRPWFLVQSLHKVFDVLKWSNGRATGHPSERLHHPAAVAAASASLSPSKISAWQHSWNTLLRLWSLLAILCTLILPHLVRGYLNLFSPSARRSPSHVRHQSNETPSLDYGSARHPAATDRRRDNASITRIERSMHGRYPSTSIGSDSLSSASRSRSRIDDPATWAERRKARVFSSSLEDDQQQQQQHDDNQTDNDAIASKQKRKKEPSPAAEYTLPWLLLVEEVTEAHTRAFSSSLFSLLKLGVGFAGFGWVIDSLITTQINKSLSDPSKLADLVRDVRKAAMPDGNLPPPVPDPTPAQQDAEWHRLRRRILANLPPLVRTALLGPDTHGTAQYRTLTRFLDPLCAPDAAGPNTHLAVMVLERVIVALCPDLVE